MQKSTVPYPRRFGFAMGDKMKADFQQVANDDTEFREIIGYSGITVMESHQAWCGPCDCIRPNLWKLSLADEGLKFATACSDKVPQLKEFMGKVQPIFFIYKGGKKLATIEGVNGNHSPPKKNDNKSFFEPFFRALQHMIAAPEIQNQIQKAK